MADHTLFVSLVVAGLGSGAAVGITAMGLALVLRVSKVLHLAHGATLIAAAYTVYAVQARGLPLPVALGGAVVVCVALGLAVERLVYEPLRARGTPALNVAIASLAVLILAENVVLLAAGGQTRPLSGALTSVGWSWQGYRVTALTLATLVLALAASSSAWLVLTRTRFGHLVTAVSINPARAALAGGNVRLARYGVAALAAGIAVVPAFASALSTGVRATSALQMLLLGLTGAVVGGLDSVPGAFIGGLLVGVVKAAGVYWLSGLWELSLVFALLTAAMIIRPHGLFGSRAAWNH